MAGVYVKNNGAWKLPKSIWINQLGTWRVCKNVYVNKSGAWKELIKTVDITNNQSNFNLHSYLGSPSQALSVIVNISGGVEIYSSNTSGNRTPAFTVGNFPTGSTVIINNNGYISGGGGFGGRGGGYVNYGRSYQPAGNGTAGGVGITKGSSNNYDCTIVNTGTIAGGGGGGGGGNGRTVCPPQPPNIYFSGCGYVNGNIGGQGAGITGGSRTQGGSPMTFPDRRGNSYPNTATGGAGGALGESGASNGTPTGAQARTGGAGGKAITGNIEIAVSGTIIGVVG